MLVTFLVEHEERPECVLGDDLFSSAAPFAAPIVGVSYIDGVIEFTVDLPGTVEVE